MINELQALEEKKTWNVVNLPHGKKVICYKWV